MVLEFDSPSPNFVVRFCWSWNNSLILNKFLIHNEIKWPRIFFFFQIIRQDVYTDMNLVPILPVKSKLPLNAYALDFFKHGSSIVIENENG